MKEDNIDKKHFLLSEMYYSIKNILQPLQPVIRNFVSARLKSIIENISTGEGAFYQSE